MDSYAEDWNEIIEGGLTREVAGGLDPALVMRIEELVEQERTRATEAAGESGRSLLLLFAVWLVLATGLVVLHIHAAPPAYEALLTALRSVAEGARLDLIATATAALLLTEAAARLIRDDRARPRRGLRT